MAEENSGWKRNLGAAWLAQMFSIMGIQFVLPFMPFYLPRLGVTGESAVKLWAGLITAATPLTMVVFAPIWGTLADRHGRKLMVLRSMFGGAVVLSLMSLARSPWHLLFLRMMQGALTGTVTASVALVSSVVPEKRAGAALGMMQAAVFVGTSIGPLLGGITADKLNYPAAFLISAGILALGGVIAKVFIRENFTPAPADGNGHIASFGAILGVSGFLVALFALFQVRFANSASSAMFPLVVRRVLGTEQGAPTVAGIILSSAGVAAALLAGPMGHFGDTRGHRRLLLICCPAAALAVLPMGFVRSIDQLFLLRVLFGAAITGITPSANAIVRRITAERHLGKAYGILASTNGLGLGLGPLMGGSLAAVPAFGLPAPFIVTSVVLLLTTGLVAWRVRDDGHGPRVPVDAEA